MPCAKVNIEFRGAGFIASGKHKSRLRYNADNTCMFDLTQVHPTAEHKSHAYQMAAESRTKGDVIHPTKARKYAEWTPTS